MIVKLNLISLSNKVQLIDEADEIVAILETNTDLAIDDLSSTGIRLFTSNLEPMYPNGIYIYSDQINMIGVDAMYEAFSGTRQDLMIKLSTELLYLVSVPTNVARYVGEFDDYDDLVANMPAGTAGRFAFVINSQGTKWLPGSLLGTYYGAGFYYDTGSSWSNKNDEIYEGMQQFMDDIAQNTTDIATNAADIVTLDNKVDLDAIDTTVDISSDYNLPDAATFGKKTLVLINRSGNAYNVIANGSDTFEGEASQQILDGETFGLKVVGTDWRI